MIHIAICDDEKDFVEHLKGLLLRYSRETGEEIKITAYYDAAIDLIFLDIQMKLLNGLKAAGRIRQMDEKVDIIFLTTLTQYGLEGYKYQAANYIIKPIQYVRLKAEMAQWQKRHKKMDSPSIVIANDSGKYKILLKSLKYVETFNRNLLFHTEQENIVCYKSMKEMEKELGEKGFGRCHTSYLVNLSYVSGIKKLEVDLITGETLPISQPRRKEFTQQLTEYWGDML